MLNGTKQVRVMSRWKSDAHMYHIGYDAAASSDASTAYSLELEPTSRNVHLVTSLQQTSPRATNTANYWSTCLENSCARPTNEGYSGYSPTGSRFTGRWCNPPCVWKLGQVLKERWHLIIKFTANFMQLDLPFQMYLPSTSSRQHSPTFIV